MRLRVVRLVLSSFSLFIFVVVVVIYVVFVSSLFWLVTGHLCSTLTILLGVVFVSSFPAHTHIFWPVHTCMRGT